MAASDGLLSWRRLVDADVRDRKLALARSRNTVARAEQIEALLVGQRDRRDVDEREARARGDLPDFARERMNVLLERAIERAGTQVSAAKKAENDAVDRLRTAFTQLEALDRLLHRRAEREASEERRLEQKELDEIAGRRGTPVLAAATALEPWTEESR